MPDRYYTFSEGIVQFFALDTNPNAAWEQQLRWLEDNLASSLATWKIVFGHHAIYSSGKHGRNSDLIRRLTPLFSKYGVQLYCNGHDHHYERTKPIDGTVYLTAGGGASTRSVGKSEWTEFADFRAEFRDRSRLSL